MTLLRRLASILRWIAFRDRAETQLAEELQTYLEMSAAQKVADGVPPEEAHRLARLELGGVEQAKERVRAERHGHLLDEIWRDLRYALRMFRIHPGFSAVILLTLALGIGANAAIFSLIDALLLRTLPVPHASELVLLSLRDRADLASGGESFSVAIIRALDDRPDIFGGVGGFTGTDFTVGEPGFVRRMPGGLVTGSFYSTLGLTPSAGRLLNRDDDMPGAPVVGVISDEYWNSQYARSLSAIGQRMTLNGIPVTIVGVTPRGFSGADVGSAPAVTVAVAALPRIRPAMAEIVGPGNFWLRALARPAHGLATTEMAARLNAAWPGMADSVISPRWPAARRAAMAASVFVPESGATGWSRLRNTYTTPLYVLLGLAGVVLLIACANIATLFLARASSRQHEIAIRLAIGAGRGRILRQLLIEGGLLSCTGAAIGVAVAWVSSRFLVSLISTAPYPIELDLTPDGRVLSFAVALAAVTGIVFGLAPARMIRRRNPSISIRTESRVTRRSKSMPVLVSAQIALSLVLVAGAGLFVRTLINLQHVNPGFVADDVYVVRLERGVMPGPEQLLDVVRAMPGVMAAGVGSHTPLDGSSWSEAIMPAGQPLTETDNALIVAVGPGFMDALQMPLVTGRAFTSSDSAGSVPVAIVNERYAERFLQNLAPLGSHLVSNLTGTATDLQVVGVVRNTAASNLRRRPPAIVYVPFAQFGANHGPSLVIRVGPPGAPVAAAVQEALRRQLPAKPVEIGALATQIGGTILRERLMATLAGAFGVLALALASIGLYGLLAYSVVQRFREIGIRMALGASAAGVVKSVLFGGARLVAIGVVAGCLVAWAVTRSVESMLFQLTPTDPWAMLTAILILVGAASLASYLPARRASRIDPLRVLRDQ